MKIGIIADSPLLTTGFGIEAYHAASALDEAGHEVVCFGLKGADSDGTANLPFRIWNVDIKSRWDLLLKDFFEQEKPSQIVILIDLFNLREIMNYCRTAVWKGNTVVFLTPDGLPAYEEYVDVLRQVDKCIVTTEACKNYLNSCGIPIWRVAPSGVDMNVFKPLLHRDDLRRSAGLADRFVVGVFGRNYERKQQFRVLEALVLLADPQIVVYFHCLKKGYWDLDQIARELRVEEQIFFAGLQNESRGVAYVVDETSITSENSSESTLQMPSSFGYIERLNCCDMIVNPAHSGDLEQIIIESQACGIPLANTDDNGIMTEAVGEGGLLLSAIDVSRGRIGERIYMVDPRSLAEAIRSVKENLSLRENLRQRGFENVRNYGWSRMREAIVRAVEN